jgi:hypothetical protein
MTFFLSRGEQKAPSKTWITFDALGFWLIRLVFAFVLGFWLVTKRYWAFVLRLFWLLCSDFGFSARIWLFCLEILA